MSLNQKMAALLTDLGQELEKNAAVQSATILERAKDGDLSATADIRKLVGAESLEAEIAKGTPSKAIQDKITARIKKQEKGNSITEAKVEEIHTLALTLIRQEIDNDPEGRGYAGKSNEEIMDLMNNPYSSQGKDEENPAQDMPARINTILTGVPHTSNAIDADDIQAALKLEA